MNAAVYVPQRSGDPFLAQPSFTQKTIDNASDLRRFRKVGARPGDFVTVWPAEKEHVAHIADHADDEEATAEDDLDPDGDCYYSEHVESGREAWALYKRHMQRMEATAGRDGLIWRIHDGTPMPLDRPLVSMGEALADYGLHREAKAENGTQAGVMRRRHATLDTVLDVIGKESDNLARDTAEETSGALGRRAQFAGHRFAEVGAPSTSPATRGAGRAPHEPPELPDWRTGLSSLLAVPDLAELAGAACVSVNTLRTIATAMNDDGYEPTPAVIDAINGGLKLTDPEEDTGILAGWREALPPAALAHALDVDLATARTLHRGKGWTPVLRDRLVRTMTARPSVPALRQQAAREGRCSVRQRRRAIPGFTPQEIVQAFHNANCSDREIALLLSAHAGHWVDARTIAGIRRGETGYSGRNLAPAFASLAYTWGIGEE
jgi:hypothetical protein